MVDEDRYVEARLVDLDWKIIAAFGAASLGNNCQKLAS